MFKKCCAYVENLLLMKGDVFIMRPPLYSFCKWVSNMFENVFVALYKC